MQVAENPNLSDLFDARCPSCLVVTDQPASWTQLVQQIAELEELLLELSAGDIDAFAADAVHRIKALLQEKRQTLRAIDVA